MRAAARWDAGLSCPCNGQQARCPVTAQMSSRKAASTRTESAELTHPQPGSVLDAGVLPSSTGSKPASSLTQRLEKTRSTKVGG